MTMMNNRHKKHLDVLHVIARDVEPIKGAKIAAGIVHKNRLIAVGTNKRKSHPFQARFSSHPSAIWLHAEISAIINALRLLELKELSRSTLYIARSFQDINNKTWANCRPCDGCAAAIDEFNIKRVIYTFDKDQYKIL